MNENTFDIVINATCFCCEEKANRLTPKMKGDRRRFAVCSEHDWLSVERKLAEASEENDAHLAEGDIRLGFAYDNLMSIKNADVHISAALSYIMMAMNAIKKSKEAKNRCHKD